MEIASVSMSTGVSPSSTVATTVGGCTQVAGSGAGTTGIADVAVMLGNKAATGDSSLLTLANGDNDGSNTDVGVIIETDCCCC